GHKVGYCMLDSASNNTTAIFELQPLLESRFGADAVLIGPGERRLRCFGHGLNLGAKDMIFGHNLQAIESQSFNLDDEKAQEEEFLRWRKAGATGKGHNLVIFIKGSDQRQAAFRKVQMEMCHWDHSIMPPLNNKAHWNTVLLMINALLNCREPIELYINISLSGKTMDKKDKARLERCRLDENEWEELIQLHALLYEFWELTMKMQGSVAKQILRESSDLIDVTVYGKPGVKLVHKPITPIHTAAFTSEDGALFNVLPAFDKILSSLEEAKKKHVENSYFATCINLAWSKMDDYYQKTDISKVYLVASVLDPRVKMCYFEKSWKKEWLEGARDKLDKYWEDFTIAMKVDACRNAGESSDCEMLESQNSDTTFGSWREADDKGFENQSEWEKYLEAGRVRDHKAFSVWRWWIAHQDEYPILSQIALEVLAIPAMSTEVERVFSGYFIELPLINHRTKLTLTPLRSRLLPDAVEAVEVCVALHKKKLFVKGE
ncbi:MAG: hAT transposon family protein, partial [Bacteroidetes bacterium]